MGGKRNRNHRRESTLQDLLHDDERLASYTVSSNPYIAYSCIVPKTIDLDLADIGSLMEETFHRLKECGADDNQIRCEMNAVPEEDVPEDELIDGYVPLDLGYVIPGALLSFR